MKSLAEPVDIMQNLIATCQPHGVDVYTYLARRRGFRSEARNGLFTLPMYRVES